MAKSLSLQRLLARLDASLRYLICEDIPRSNGIGWFENGTHLGLPGGFIHTCSRLQRSKLRNMGREGDGFYNNSNHCIYFFHAH